MKNLSYLLVTLAVGAAVAGCYTSGQISEKSTDHSSFYGIREPEGSISLIDHLRRDPYEGVDRDIPVESIVAGTGASGAGRRAREASDR